MPVPLLKHHFCRRNGAGPKAHAHAAYLSGTKLDDGNGRTADFTPKDGILHAEVWVPEGAPDWAKDRGELWRRLESREDKTTRHAQAILAHKFIGALPHEISFEENVRYVKDYVREQFTRKGYAADWAIHAPDPGSDSRNFHFHIMVPLRRFENGDWARTKDRFPKNSPALSQFIKQKQQAFFELQNRYLHKNGIEVSIIRKDGKWTVVEGSVAGRGPTISGSPAAQSVLAAMRGRRPVLSLSPVKRSTPVPTLGGGVEGKTSLRETLLRAARETTDRAEPNTELKPSNLNTKGWPPAAISDWQGWGYKNPVKFFTLWPELSGGNPSPSGGGM